MRIDVHLGADLRDVGHRVRELAATGIDGLYTFEGPRDVFFPLVPAAAAPTDLRLWTNVAIALPRSPMHLAYQAFDLQRLSGGRFALGLGTQIRAHVERRFGAAWDRPVGRMRETIQALRAIFACWQDGAELDFVGEHTRHTLMPPLFDPGPVEGGPPPILAGAVGPQMTRMVAEEADGLVVHPLNSPTFLARHTLPLVDEGHRRAGRSGTDFELVCGALVGLHGGREDEATAAAAAVRGLVAFYASTPAYRVVLEHHGIEELQPALRELTREGRWDELAGLVDDDVLADFAVIGTPREVAVGLRERYEGVAGRVALSIPHDVDDALLAALVDRLHGAEG